MHIVPQAGNCGKETRAKQQEKTDPAGEQQNPFHHAGSELIICYLPQYAPDGWPDQPDNSTTVYQSADDGTR